MKHLFCITTTLLCLLWTSCGHKRDIFEGAELTPQHIQIERFDSAFIHVDTTNIDASVEQLYTRYPDFTPYFVSELLGLPNKDSLAAILPRFLADTTLRIAQTNRDEQQLFADISLIQKELDEGFTRIHYLFPEWPVPAVYLFVSGYVSPLYFPSDEIIGIGADMYLGSDYPVYNQMVYNYQKITMRKECVVGDAVSAFLFRNIPYNGTQNRLLDQMIYQGKMLFLLDQVLPSEKEEQVIGYSREQWEWCTANERDIWRLMMDKRDLFKTEALVLTSYMNDGPFTSEVSQDSPGRLGAWVGWRIIESYMTHNKDVTMHQLLENTDAQSILEHSHYRP